MTTTGFTRVLHEHVERALRAAGIDPASGTVALASYGKDVEGREIEPKVVRFEVGQNDAMASTALALTQEPHRNVYYCLQLMRRGLKGRQRGSEKDIIAVCGLVADIDGDKGNAAAIERLPLPPTFVVISSHTPHINRQPVWLFTRAVTSFEAKVLAWGLWKLIGDQDGATRDICHVWRMPGTLNWPNPAKRKRGRPETPQRATLDETLGSGEPVDRQTFKVALEQALAAELGGKGLGEAYAAETGAKPKDKAKTRKGSAASEDERGDDVAASEASPAWSGDHFDGNPRELERIMNALLHLSPESGAIWRNTWVGACHTKA